MGSYGIGVSRLTAAIIEAFHDENGIRWPFKVSPFKINIISSSQSSNTDIANKLLDKLNLKYGDVSYDDRDLSMGRKIKDSELIGIPWAIIIGKQYEENNHFEIINRSNGEKLFLNESGIESFQFEQYTP